MQTLLHQYLGGAEQVAHLPVSQEGIGRKAVCMAGPGSPAIHFYFQHNHLSSAFLCLSFPVSKTRVLFADLTKDS